LIEGNISCSSPLESVVYVAGVSGALSSGTTETLAFATGEVVNSWPKARLEVTTTTSVPDGVETGSGANPVARDARHFDPDSERRRHKTFARRRDGAG
jgi:hypothetical protein